MPKQPCCTLNNEVACAYYVQKFNNLVRQIKPLMEERAHYADDTVEYKALQRVIYIWQEKMYTVASCMRSQLKIIKLYWPKTYTAMKTLIMDTEGIRHIKEENS
jgi:hypothetical protein